MLHAVNVSTLPCTVTQLHKGEDECSHKQGNEITKCHLQAGDLGAAAGPETRLLSLAFFILQLTASTSSIYTRH